jgi:hypothetical protein
LIQTNKTKSNRYKSLVWVSVMNMNLILSRNSVWWILIHYNDSIPILRLGEDILTCIFTMSLDIP